MGLKLVTGPAIEPVTTLEAKYQLSISADVTEFDALIARLISAARAWSETYAERAWIEQTWRLSVDRFPLYRSLYLPRAPLSSITSVTYVDSDGATQTLSTDIYEADTDSEPGVFRLKYDQSWPTARFHPGSIKITYVAGYGDEASDVPEDARHAILMLVAHLFENREASTEKALRDTPMAVASLLSHYRSGVVPGGYVLE